MCPLVNKADPRCGAQLTLRNVTRAVAYCANRYTACPIYQDLIAHDAGKDKGKPTAAVLAAS